MKTPEQIRDMEFQKSTMGGYKQSDVELFLEEVASQIEILLRQKNEAERKLQELTKKAPEAALSTASIQSVLINAQKVAEQVVEEAKANAEGIENEANLKLTEADIKAKEILADAESKAILFCETAETEAAKIIAAAKSEAETIIAEAKESVELEQKLYDRMKIEIADFRKKAAEQCGALIELINQLPGEIPFNIERSKTVLSTDFSDPAELLKAAVEARLAKQAVPVETVTPIVEEPKIEAPQVEEPVAEPKPTEEFVIEESKEDVVAVLPMEDEKETPDEQLEFDNIVATEETVSEEEEEVIPFTVAAEEPAPAAKPKSRISFGEDDDDDDDDEDDEPRLFFRRKKK